MGQAASAHLTGLGTQLIKASKAGDADAVTELVSSNPQLLRYCTFRHLGPCHYAARGDHVEVLQQLVAKAQEIEQLQWQAAAAASGAKAHARLVAQSAAGEPGNSSTKPSLVKQLVNATSDRGVTPLMLAVDGGCAASVKLLLEKGADPWAVDKLGGRTALHYAARSDSAEILELLVEAAGESGPVNFPNRPNTKYVDVRTQTGFTAVHFAVQYNNQEALAVLLNLGANPLLSSLFDCMDTINCPKGTTALHLTARQGNEALAKQLLRAYVEQWYHRHLPDPRLLLDGDNFLPCQVAARRSHADVARLLLPSNPITSMFSDGDINLLGPPTLAAIAGAVLRSTLASDLDQLAHTEEQLDEQQQQQQEEGEAAGQHSCAQQQCDLSEAPAAADASAGADDAAVAVEVEASSVDVDDAAPAAAAAAGSTTAQDHVCGVCFDAAAQVKLAPCGHELCMSCCRSLLALNSRCVMMCPFCRGGVAHLAPTAVVAAPSSTPTAAADSADAAPAPVALRPQPAVALTSPQLVL